MAKAAQATPVLHFLVGVSTGSKASMIYPLHTELSQRPACPVSAEDLSVAEWEHCASAAAVRNRFAVSNCLQKLFSGEERFNCLLAWWHQCRRLYLCAPLAGRAFHRGLCRRRQGRREHFLMGKRQDPICRTRVSRAGQPCLRYVALENECESKKTKPALQIPDLD